MRWLMDEGFSVHAFLADLGQEEDFDAARTKATAVRTCLLVVKSTCAPQVFTREVRVLVRSERPVCTWQT